MKIARILVTGANGFVGQALCRRLNDLGYEVYGLDRNGPVLCGFAGFYREDITKTFTINKNFDFVFHLAAYNVTHVGRQSIDLYHLVNVQGTENVLKSAKAGHFVFLSTAKVYASQGKPIDENSPLLPLQEYEKSKCAAEEVCRRLTARRSLLIFRSVNIVGPGQREKAVIPILFKKAAAGEPLEIFGPRGSVLQLLFVEDVVDAFVKAVERKNLYGVYNLASPSHIRLDALAEAIKKKCHSTSEIHFTNDTAGLFSEVVATKAEKAFFWKAKISIKEILESYQ